MLLDAEVLSECANDYHAFAKTFWEKCATLGLSITKENPWVTVHAIEAKWSEPKGFRPGSILINITTGDKEKQQRILHAFYSALLLHFPTQGHVVWDLQRQAPLRPRPLLVS